MTSRVFAKNFLVTSILAIGLSVNCQAKLNLNSKLSVTTIITARTLADTLSKSKLKPNESKVVPNKPEVLQNLPTQMSIKKTTETGETPTFQTKLQKQELPFWIPLLIFLLILYWVVLWKKPILLLKLPAELSIPKIGSFPGAKIPISVVFWLKYRPRVLDAWVDERIHKTRMEFEERSTVKKRNVHVFLPVKLDEEEIASLNPNTKGLKQIFSKQEVRLLILGEGGIGKTSWACQLAKWAMMEDHDQRLCQHFMIPILVEDELEAIDNTSALTTTILRQLKNLSDDEKPISEELLNQLLKKRRLLIIVDHISEMNEASRKALRLKDPNSSINALVITSRTEKIFGNEITYSQLKPQRVASGQLLKFMDDYLRQLNKRNLFPDDAEYIDDFKRLSLIVSGKREITVLFAKLYLEQMVAKVERQSSERMPENVPELMLSYLNELNYNLAEKELRNEIVHKTAKVTAWECLRVTFKPETAERERILETLISSESSNGGIDVVEKNLLYLETRLQIIRRVPPSLTRVRFELDPLAEYLASLLLIENYKDNISQWEKLFNRLNEIKSTGDEINGFLFTLYDSCVSKSNEYRIPSYVIDILSKLSGVDTEEIEYQKIINSIKRLTESLSHASYEEVNQIDKALEEITGINRRFTLERQKLVIRALVSLSNVENSTSRAKVIELLGKCRYISEQVLHVLEKAFEDSDPNVRSKTVHACAWLRLSTDSMNTLLTHFLHCLNDKDDLVRTNTALAIGHLDLTSEEIEVAVQALLDCCNHSKDYDVDFSVAVGSLGNIGSRSRQQEFILKTILDYVQSANFDRQNQYSFGKGSFASALGNFHPKDDLKDRTFQVLKSLLHDSDHMVRFHAAHSLKQLSSIIGEDSIYEICNQLQEENDDFARSEMIRALYELIDSSNDDTKSKIKQSLEMAFRVAVIKHERYSQELPLIIEALKKFGYSTDDLKTIISTSFNDHIMQRRANLNLTSVEEQAYHY